MYQHQLGLMRGGAVIKTHAPPYSEPDTRHELRSAGRSAELDFILIRPELWPLLKAI